MRIAQNLIDQILDRVDLVELIHARVPLKKAGKSYTACCPFHHEKSPSFHVNREKGFYHCFGCQANGNAIGFLMNYERLHFIEAVEVLARQAGITLPKLEANTTTQYKSKQTVTRPSSANKATTHTATAATSKLQSANALATLPNTVQSSQGGANSEDDSYFNSFNDQDLAWLDPQDNDALFAPHDDDAMPSSAPDTAVTLIETDKSLYDLLQQICAFYQSSLKHAPTAQLYIEKRGLSDKTCQHWQIGYAPSGWSHLTERFAADIDGLIKLGLVRTSESGRQYNLLRDRIIFPIKDRKGRVVGFGGRALNDEVKPKYINSPDSPVFHKNALLFGLYEALQSNNPQWLVVEGYMDVIALAQQGITGAVAAMGTATNAEHMAMLFKYTAILTLAFDGDSAGQKAAWRTLEYALPLLSDGRELRFLLLPTGHDPDSLIRNEGALAFNQRIDKAPPLSDFLYSQLTAKYSSTQIEQPEYKAAVYQQCKTYIQLLPATGTFRRLLDLTIRNKLGLGWRQKGTPNPTDSLDYQQLPLADKLIALSLVYPVLVRYIVPILPLLGSDNILTKLYQYINAQAPDIANLPLALPSNPAEAATSTDAYALVFYLLGAWDNASEQQHLCHIIEHSNINQYIGATEQIVIIFQELLLQYAKQILKHKNTRLQLAEKSTWHNKLAELEKTLYQARSPHTVQTILHTLGQS